MQLIGVNRQGLQTDMHSNGNLTSRVVDGAAFLFAYDAENHLTGVSGAVSATFMYDGDGVRKALTPLRSHVVTASRAQ